MELYGIVTVGITAIVVVACVIAYCVIQTKRHFLCPRCGARFKVSGLKSFFASRQGTDRLLSCPECGANVYMENIHDEDYLKELKAKEQRETQDDKEKPDDE